MRAIILSSVSALFLTGCLTTQENPNYEFSSRYNQGATPVAETIPLDATVASYETQPAAPITNFQTVATPPQPNVIIANSPTGEQYEAQDVTGTPGYMALAQQSPEIVTNSSAQPITYDYSQNLIVADTSITGAGETVDIRILPSVGIDYRVQPGDTVYGLSRRTCVGIDIIRSMNGIGEDYGIDIGQTIRLPESRC